MDKQILHHIAQKAQTHAKLNEKGKDVLKNFLNLWKTEEKDVFDPVLKALKSTISAMEMSNNELLFTFLGREFVLGYEIFIERSLVVFKTSLIELSNENYPSNKLTELKGCYISQDMMGHMRLLGGKNIYPDDLVGEYIELLYGAYYTLSEARITDLLFVPSQSAT